MASNFWDIFGSHISGTGGQKQFSLGNGFTLTKSTLYLKMKKIWVGQYTKVPILPDFNRQWLLTSEYSMLAQDLFHNIFFCFF